MKKILLASGLLLGTAYGAHAQLSSYTNIGIGIYKLATRDRAADLAAKDQDNGLSTSTYEGKSFRTQRTPADKLPRKGAEQITALEAQLERCRMALVAAPTGAICTPEQRAALQQALVAVARTGQTQNLPVYQEEAAFYLAEDTRRQPPAPTN